MASPQAYQHLHEDEEGENPRKTGLTDSETYYGSFNDSGAVHAHTGEALTTRKYLLTTVVVLLVLTGITMVVLIVGYDIFSRDNEPSWAGQPEIGGAGAVAAESEVCSQIGLSVLKKGGNAVDAAIAADLCVGIVHCFATGIGGGGVMVVWMPNGSVAILDYRETAPAASTFDMFNATNASSTVGGMAVAIPGEIKGLYAAWQQFGILPWADVLADVVDLAASFEVDSQLATRLQSNSEYVFADPGLSEVFAPDGTLLEEGDICQWTALSLTLDAVAKNGSDIFYYGDIAKNLVADVQDNGGILTEEDMADYSVQSRVPIETFYRGYKVYGAPPPFSGGSIMALTLNMVERYNFPVDGRNAQNDHYLIQSFKFAYSDRGGEGDPASPGNEDLMTTFIPTMISKDHAAELRQRVVDDETFPPEYYYDLVEVPTVTEDHGTSHLSTADKGGMAVALTSTINLSFGAKFMSPSTGVILNNEMDDFSTPGQSNYFGYPPSEANFPYPGSRPLSSMTPTIVSKDGAFYAAIGASGGSIIPTATIQSLLNVIDYNENVYDAIQRPRMHDQWVPSLLQCEPDYPTSWVESFRRYGYNISVTPDAYAVVQGIVKTADGKYSAASDRRKKGKAAAYDE